MTPRILIVDDEESIRFTFQAFLSNAGYATDIAPDLETAAGLIAETSYSIIITDVILPGNRSGLDLLIQAKEVDEFVEVIMVTGKPDFDTMSRSHHLRAYDYLIKPVLKDDLLRLTGKALESRDLKQKKAALEEENRTYRKHLEELVQQRTHELIETNRRLRREIDEREQTQNALQESEEKYRLLFRTIPVGVVITDDKGETVEANEASAELLGMEPTEFGNMTYDTDNLEVWTDDGRLLGPQDIPLYRTVTHGETIRNSELFFKYRGREVFFNITTAPVPLEGYGAAAVFYDISERKKAEEILRRSEERFRLLAENSRDVIFRISAHTGRFDFVSRSVEDLTGYKPEDFYKRKHLGLKLLKHDWRYYLQRAWNKALSGKPDPNQEYPLTGRNGTVRWVFQRIRAVKDENGKVRAVEGALTDITERKWAEEKLAEFNRILEDEVKARTMELEEKARQLSLMNEELKELDRMKSTFMAAVSHELRTPLTSIRGFAKLVLRDFIRHFADGELVAGSREHGENSGKSDKAKISGRMRENLEILIQESDNLTDIINDVLSLLSLREAGKLDNKDRIVLPELIESAVRVNEQLFRSKPGIRLRIVTDPDLPVLHGDKKRILQLLANLVNNAVKFTEHGEIGIFAESNGSGITLSVSDTGKGLEPECKDNIFDAFYQMSEPASGMHKPKGAGLGLALCREIVNMFGGDITVESEPDKGSTFHVTFPRSMQTTGANAA